MAYCDNCGAYIPDGQTKCLACGYDENAAKAAEAAAAAAQKKEERHQPNFNSFDSEQLRRQLEQQREKQRENSRKWAEAERARRQQQEDSQHRANSRADFGMGDGYSYSNTQRSSGMYEGNETSRRMGIISYLGGLWLIPFIFCRDDRFAMYHAKQGLVLSIASAVATAAASILSLGWVVTLARIYMIYKGISNAHNGKMEPLPYIGDIVSKF